MVIFTYHALFIDRRIHDIRSLEVLAVQQSTLRSHKLWLTRKAHQCPAYGADRILSLCAFICSRQLGEGGGQQFLIDDEELPVEYMRGPFTN